MSYSLKLALPNIAKGGEVALSGIDDALENGKTHEITDEQVAQFEAQNGTTLDKAFKDHKHITVTKTAKSSEGGDTK